MCDRRHPSYYAADLITEVFSGGQSSRLHQALVKEKKLFSQIDCSHTGSVENGLLVFEGRILPGIKPEDADAAITIEIEKLKAEKISDAELEKVKKQGRKFAGF